MVDVNTIKFGEYVWHDQPYLHPQLQQQVERDFFDRTLEKKRAEDSLRASTRKPVIIRGERRSGKTSLLRLLEHHLANDPAGLFVPVLIPWQGIGSRDELFEEIRQGIVFELDQDLPDETPGDGQTPYSMTVVRYIETLRRLLAPVSAKTVVICIDEIDSIIEEAADFQEKNKILGLMTALAEASDLPIKLLLTLSRFPDLPRVRSSPLVTRAELINLPPFEKQDLDEMARRLSGSQAGLSEEDLQFIFYLSGGWPYFAKLLLVCLLEQAPGAHRQTQALARALAYPVLKETLEHIYDKHFDDAEKAMVLLCATDQGQVKAEKMEVLSDPLKAAAKRLADRHFLTEGADGSFSFMIGFLSGWFPAWNRFEAEVYSRLTETLRGLERLEDPYRR
jgi:hypothetical protein